MVKGSQLSQLKSALSNAGITKSQPSKKRKRPSGDAQLSEKDKKAAKLKEIHERMNPFDVKVTKLKHDVGGRKLKGVGGRPAASKQAGIEQRKNTLLKEYEEKGRVGGILDRRFGENDPTMTPEERMLERFTRERQRTARGGAAFNLEDEAELTHYGQSLSKSDDFDDAGIHLSDEDEEAPGQIDEHTVKKVHFGGFDEEDDEEDEEGQPERKKSKAEVMAEVIAKSKEHKALRQISRQQDEDLRHEVDNELDSIRNLLFAADSSLTPLELSTLPSQTTPLVQVNDTTKPSVPPATNERDVTFDQYVRELAFEKRAKPKDRTKSEEELAAEEKEKLEKAERRRQRRMQGEDDYDSEEEETKARVKRRKAAGGDDLEDDFYEEPGALGVGLEDAQAAEEDGASDETDEEDEESSEEEDDEDNDDDGSEGEGVVVGDDGDDEDKSEEDHDHEDLVQPLAPSTVKRRETASQGPKELPFTFPCPKTHDEFLEIVQDVDDADIPTVVQRIRALHHPSLAEGNKFKLQNLAGVLVDYVLYIASPPTPRFEVLSGILSHLAALTATYPITSAAQFVSKLALMEKNFRRGVSHGPLDPAARTFPGLPELALLRVVGALWPTSDMQHAVISPARLLMGAYLALSRVRSLQDLGSGLFLCTLWLQFEERSRRFVPEAVTFTTNALLHLAPHSYATSTHVPGAFPCPDLNSDLCKPLQIDVKKARKAKLVGRTPDLVAVLISGQSGEQEKADLLVVTLQVLLGFADMYKDLDAFLELYQPIFDILTSIPSDRLPGDLQTRITSSRDTIGRLLKFAHQSRQPLMLQAHKPIPIPTYMPQFESSGGSSYLKRRDPDTERAAAAKLRREYKQERKGAMRELRKDARFLAGVQQQAQVQKDRGYEERMRRVHGSLEGERAEEKRMEKEKMKVKRRAGKR